jgi:hypothetical protein
MSVNCSGSGRSSVGSQRRRKSLTHECIQNLGNHDSSCHLGDHLAVIHQVQEQRSVGVLASGSPQAGPKVAAILSVVESCRRLKIRVRDYLASILPGLADLPIQRVPALTPAAWRRIPNVMGGMAKIG